MLFWQECVWCDGEGRTHSAGRNGDPDDNGVICERCNGDGGRNIEVDEDGDEI